MAKPQYNIFFDYETTKEDKPRIYIWTATVDKDAEIINSPNIRSKEYKNTTTYYGITDNSFIEFMQKIPFKGKFIAHNMSRFDGHFLYPLLERNGYKCISKHKEIVDNNERFNFDKDRFIRVKEITDNWKENSIKRKRKISDKDYTRQFDKNWNRPTENEYDMIMKHNKTIISMQVSRNIARTKRFNNKTESYDIINIWDSWLMCQGSIDSYGEALYKTAINKDKITDKSEKDKIELYYKKMDMDHNVDTLYNSFEELEQDGNRLDYAMQDTFILYSFMKEFGKIIKEDYWKSTIASMTIHFWINIFGDKLLTLYLANGSIRKTDKFYVYKKTPNKKWFSEYKLKKYLIEELFPTKWLDKDDNHIKMYPSYGGGLVHVSEDKRGEILEDLYQYDVNSEYPSVMNSDTLFPWGEPITSDFDNNPKYNYKFYTITVLRPITNRHGLPFIDTIIVDKKRKEYRRTLPIGSIVKITSTNLDRFMKYYNVKKSDIKLETDFAFLSVKGSFMFKEFYDYWIGLKNKASEEGNELLKTIAKLFANSLYGKFGTKQLRKSKINLSVKQELEDIEKNIESKFYLPIACTVTEGGRAILVDAVGNNYDRFVYCDTDSITTIGSYKDNLEIHKTKLGAWKEETSNGVGIFRRGKQYLIKTGNSFKFKYAGVNIDLVITDKTFKKCPVKWSDMIKGCPIPNQLKSVKIHGVGVRLDEIEKQITPIWSFNKMDEQIKYKPEHFINDLKKAIQLDTNECHM